MGGLTTLISGSGLSAIRGHNGGPVELADFGPLTTPTDVVNTFNAAVAAMSSMGSNTLLLPGGRLVMGAFPPTQVSSGQGDGVRLTTATDGLIFQGSGTILEPETNEIVMFSGVGANSALFDGIHFYNPHGVLQNQVKPGSQTPGGGVAGLGNAANSAIKQFYGGVNAAIASGTYDDGTGTVVLSMSVAGSFTVGNKANLFSLTGTGAVASLNNIPWLITEATATTVTIAGAAGLGASTITGGTLHAYSADSRWETRNCQFTQFHTSTGYFGNYLNDDELAGDLVVDNTKYKGCVFGVLCQQPETLRFTNWDYSDGINSINASSNDPGHGLYFANRGGAFPKTVVVSDATGTNNMSSLIKIRKAEAAAVSNFAVYSSVRGAEFWNCKALVVSNGAVRLGPVTGSTDTNGSGLEFTDCGDAEVSNMFIDRSGANAWGVRIRGDDPDEPWQNVDSRLRGITVKDNSSASTGKPFITVNGQTDFELAEPIARLTANVAHAQPVVAVSDSTRIRIKRPQRRAAAAGIPTGSDRLVSFDADTTESWVEYARNDLDTAPTANTVIDNNGTNKTYRVDGEESGTWTPTLNFATPDGGAITINSSDCLWFKRGPNWRLVYNLDFSTNVFTTAAGALQLTGTLDITGNPALPVCVTANRKAAAGLHQQLVGTATDIGASIDTGDNFITFRRSVMAGAGATLAATTNIPASTANFVLAGEINLLAGEA